MENIIIIALLIVLIIFGINSGKKHFRGEGGCCGGSSPTPKQNKKLKNVTAKKVITIEGMTCEHCKNRVEKCINDIDGAAAKVNLSKKEAVVSYEKHVDDETICAAIEKAGYTVLEIRKINI